MRRAVTTLYRECDDSSISLYRVLYNLGCAPAPVSSLRIRRRNGNHSSLTHARSHLRGLWGHQQDESSNAVETITKSKPPTARPIPKGLEYFTFIRVPKPLLFRSTRNNTARCDSIAPFSHRGPARFPTMTETTKEELISLLDEIAINIAELQDILDDIRDDLL